MAIEEELSLDVADALRSVDRVGDALEKAVDGFRADLRTALSTGAPQFDVDVDAAGIRRSIEQAFLGVDPLQVDVDEAALTAAINRAVDRSDSTLNLGVDTAGITAAINAAVARASNSVTITGDASSITGAINAAIANANQNVNLTGNVNLAGADDAASSTGILAGNLKTVAATLAGFVGVDAILRIVEASSDLTEAQTKVQAVFKDSADEIFAFADGSAARIGFAESAALEALGTFGNFFTSSGLATEQAAEMSQVLLDLAADLASFNNIDTQDAFIKLRAGLAGEIEPLRAIGIAITEAETKAKALELGLVDLGEELTQADRLQARYALILEKSANAQGDFARTSDGLANQQRILRAQFEDIITVVGAPLVSPLLSLLQTFVPTAGSAADAFGRVVGAVLPAVDALTRGAAPALEAVFEGVGDTADALAPALEDTGEALGAVVGAATPVIEVLALVTEGVAETVTTLLTFNDGLGVVLVGIPLLAAYLASLVAPAVAAVGGIGGVTIALQGLFFTIAANPVGALLVLFGLLAAALLGLRAAAGDTETIMDRVNQAMRTADQQFSSTSDSAQEVARSVVLLDNDFAEFIETSSTFSTNDQVLALQRLDQSYADLRDQLRDGARGVNDFTAAAVEAGEVTLATRYGVQLTADEIRSLGTSVTAYIAQGDLAISGNEDLIASFQDQVFALQALEAQTFQSLIAQGQLTQAQADIILTMPEVANATDLYGAALGVVATGLDEVNAKLPETEIPLGQQGSAWAALADSILRGTTSSRDYQAVADTLGVSLETVAGFADSVTGSIDKFVEAAVAGLPDAADAFGSYIGYLGATDPQQVIDNLNLQTLAIQTFVANIELIREKSPEAADFLLGLGEAAAGPFAQDLVDGKVSIEEFQATLANNQAALDEAEQTIRDSAIDEAAYSLGASASEELGLGLDFTGTTQEQIDNVSKTLREASSGAPVSAAGQLGTAIGAELTRAMKEELGINSPSQVAIDLGEQVARGLAIGLTRGDQPVIDASTGLAGAALPGAQSFDNSRTTITVPVSVAGVGAAEAEQVGAAVGATVADVLAEVLAL